MIGSNTKNTCRWLSTETIGVSLETSIVSGAKRDRAACIATLATRRAVTLGSDQSPFGNSECSGRKPSNIPTISTS